jgi:hypothetical protein
VARADAIPATVLAPASTLTAKSMASLSRIMHRTVPSCSKYVHVFIVNEEEDDFMALFSINLQASLHDTVFGLLLVSQLHPLYESMSAMLYNRGNGAASAFLAVDMKTEFCLCNSIYQWFVSQSSDRTSWKHTKIIYAVYAVYALNAI